MTNRTRLLALTSLFSLSAAACGGASAPEAKVSVEAPTVAAVTVAAPEAAAPPGDAPSAADVAMSPPPPPAAPKAGGARAEPIIAEKALAARPKSVGEASGAVGRRAPAATVPAKKEKADADVSPSEPVAPVGVRAGEWDDNANYREFTKWLGTESQIGNHKVDVRDRQFIVVRDADGKAVPRCAVSVRDDKQRGVVLTTTASGRALLFPHAEGLNGNLTASTSCLGDARSLRFSTAAADGIVDLKLDKKRAAPTREVEIGFVLDTTGSMSEEIQAVKATIQKVSRTLNGQGVHVKMGLVEYKDRTDDFVTRVYPMTEDAVAFGRSVDGLSASGGGDYPESVNEGLHVGLNRLDWGGPAAVKMAILIGDAPPHLDYANDFDYAVDMKDASHRGIQVLTIAASGMDEIGQVVWRQIAQYTNATNLFVLRGGAGPESTGGGDPLASFGGTHTQYRSGNLDSLIVERVRRELGALDRDPMKIPGAGRDENAKPPAERLQVAG